MKTFFNTFIVRFAMLVACLGTLIGINGCVEEDMPYIVLNYETIEASTDASKYTIDVKTNLSWDAACDQEWIQLYNPKGQFKGQFDIAIEPNETTSERSAMITVTSVDGSVQSTIMVKQAPKTAELFLTEESVIFSKAGGTHNIRVVSNHKWNVLSSEDWCTVSPSESASSGQFEITAEANATGAVRKATLTVVCEINVEEPIIRTIEVTQLAQEFFFVVPLKEYFFNNEEKDFEIKYQADGDNIKVDQLPSVDWLKVVKSEDKCVTIHMEENLSGADRSGKIILTASSNDGEPIMEEVTVTQSGEKFFFTVPTKDFKVTNAKETLHINYETSDAEAEIRKSANVDWISFPAAPATKSANIVRKDFEAQIEENITGAERSGKITIVAICNGQEPVTETIEIIQSGEKFYFKVAEKELKLESSAKDLFIEFETNDMRMDLRPSSNVEWINFEETVRPLSTKSIEREAFFAHVDANISGKDRTGKITVVAVVEGQDPVTETIEIIQSGDKFYFALPHDSYEVNSKENKLTIEYETSDNTAQLRKSSNVDWISFPETPSVMNAGETSRESFDIKVNENTTGKNRTGKVTVVAMSKGQFPVTETFTILQTGEEYYFIVSQKERQLKNNETAFEFTWKTNVKELVVNAEPSATWITADEQVGNAFKFTAEVNEGEARTATISLSAEVNGKPVVETVKVAQEAAAVKEVFFTLVEKEKEIGSNADYMEIRYETNVDPKDISINARPSADWVGEIRINKIDKALTFGGITENTTGKDREARLDVVATVGNQTFEQVCIVRQLAGPKEEEPFFTIVEKEKEIGSVCERLEISYKTNVEDQLSLEVGSSAEWLSGMSYENGVILFATVEENKTGKDRTARVDIVANVGEKVFEQVCMIRQLAGPKEEEPYFTLLQNEKEIGFDWNKFEFGYETNIPAGSLNVRSESSANWLEEIDTNPLMKVIRVNRVFKNETGKERVSNLNIFVEYKGKTFQQTCKIIQKAGELSYFVVPQKEVNLGSEDKSFELVWETNVNALEVTPTSSAQWMKLDPAAVENGLKFNAEPNTTGAVRTASINLTATINGKPVTETVKVSQDPLPAEAVLFTIVEKEKELPFNGKWLEISYETNVEDIVIKAETSASWLGKVTDIRDAKKLKLDNIAENTTGKDREGRVDIVAVAGDQSFEYTCTVKQLAGPSAAEPFFTIVEKEKEIGSVCERLEISYKTNVEDQLSLEVGSSAEWLSGMSYENGVILFATVEENKTGKDRTARVDIVANVGEKVFEQSCMVKQLAGPKESEPYFTLLQTEKEIGFDWNKFEFGYETNIPAGSLNVRAESSANWLEEIDTNPLMKVIRVNRVFRNETGKERVSNLNIFLEYKGKTYQQTCKIIQKAGELPYFVVPQKEVNLSSEDKTFKLTWKTNVNALEVTPTSSAQWMTLDPEAVENGFMFNAEPNTTGVVRTASINLTATINGKPVVETIKVSQESVKIEEEYFTLIENERRLDSREGGFLVEWITNIDSIGVINTRISANWLWLVEDDSNEKHSFIHVSENTTPEPREAEVTINTMVNGKSVTLPYKVYQAGKPAVEIVENYFTVLQKEFQLTSKDTTFTVAWESDIADLAITPTSSVSWLHLEKQEGKNITFKADSNTDGAVRTATINLTANVNGKPMTETIKVSQASVQKTEEYFSLVQNEVKIRKEGGTLPIKWRTNIAELDITINSSDNWIWLDENGVGTTEATMAFSENTGTETRESEITLNVMVNGKPVTLPYKVYQAGAAAAEKVDEFFSVPQKTKQVVATGANFDIIWDSNVDALQVTVESDATWMQKVNNTDKKLTMHADENNSGAERTGNVTLSARINGKTVSENVVVSQQSVKIEEEYFALIGNEQRLNNRNHQFPVAWKTNIKNVKVETHFSTSWMQELREQSTDGSVFINVEDNLTSEPREGEITINTMVNGKPEAFSYKIYQDANPGIQETEHYFIVPQKEFHLNTKETAFTVAWESDLSDLAITPSVSDTWLHVGVQEGKNITFNVDPNPNESERPASITLTAMLNGKPVTETIQVLQAGEKTFFEIARKQYGIDMDNNFIPVRWESNKSNVNLRFESTEPWISIKKDTGSQEFTIIAKANMSESPRTAQVIVTANIDGKIIICDPIVIEQSIATEGYFILKETELKIGKLGGGADLGWETDFEPGTYTVWAGAGTSKWLKVDPRSFNYEYNQCWWEASGFPENDPSDNRTGIIVLEGSTTDGKTFTKQVYVTQSRNK